MGEKRLATEWNKASNPPAIKSQGEILGWCFCRKIWGALLFLTPNINNALKNNLQFIHL